ncbi:hypothetical protein I4U23_002703 [Adineta vaga]|nr:hypothetical protein I4U23_002703 [Adineta vaga]
MHFNLLKQTMASSSSNIKQCCVKCDKGGGIAICSGCHQQFCIKHFIEHRQELTLEMDQIGQQHDLFRRDLSNELPRHPLLTTIDMWEQESITKIQVTAELARADLQQLLDRTKTEMNISIDKLTTELQSSQELDDYTEIDLAKWKNKLIELRILFDTPVTKDILINNHSESSIHLIKINTSSTNQPPSSLGHGLQLSERFDRFYGSVIISEKGRRARNMGDNYSRICCTNQYSSGIHQIRFRVDEQINSCPLLGIISSLEELHLRKITLPSVNGWSDLDYAITNGKSQGTLVLNRTIQTGDEIILVIDCDHR